MNEAVSKWPEKFWREGGEIYYEGGNPSDAFIFVEEFESIAVYYHRTTEDEVIAFVDEEDNFTIMEAK